MTRMPYDRAVNHRPRGACYCDLDDRHCYEAGHWQAVPWHQREASGLVTLVALALFISTVALGVVLL